ncbi:adaptin N terminal region-domain-containing protein [Gaertneriomyces semiglobifer]|nr:adaptin N terminal region-domain-containing protein [Gaertneriomyces semiglobifer]
MSDAKYFQRGKIHDLRLELTSDRKDPKHSKKKVALKKIVANMTMGNDMSALFPDVIACMGIQMLDIKKMVYLYVMNYARARSDMAVLAVNSLSRDAEDPNPLIRALAIRTMGYINVDPIMTELLRPLHRCLSDKDPYVCKTAAITVVKLFMHNRQLVDSEGFLPELQALLNHDNSTVVANAVAALIEISSRSDDFNFELDVSQANKLLTALNESSEWGQAYLLDAITFCAPQSSQDAELLADRVLSRLQHANSAVVLTACRVIIYLTHYISNTEVVSGLVKKLAAPLVTLLHSQPEIQYISLRNILLLLNHTPTLLNKDLKVFFCKYNDPIYVKLSKLEILVRLADASNIGEILSELKEYASEVDVDFVRKSVRCVGRCAVRIEQGADRCVNALVELIRGGVSYVVQEAIVVIKDIFRKYPNRYESLLTVLCEALDTLDSPDAKASMIWIVGQYAERIDNAGELLSGFLEGFLDEPANVQLALLTAIVKLFIKRPSVGQDLVPRVLKYATEEVGSPDLRDRGYIYWRLLSTDPVAAKAIILSDKPAMQGDELMDPVLLEELLLNVGCLSSVWGKSERSFVGGVQPRGVRPSRALVFRQKGEMMPEEGMGETGAVYGNQFENELGMGGMMSTGGLNTGVMGGGLDGLGGDGAMGGLGDLLDLDMGEENMSMGMTMGMEGGADLSGVFGGMGGDTTTSGMNTSLSWE